MENIQRVDNEKLRKLPKFWKKMNFLYQFLMVLLAFANVILTTIDNNDTTTIPKLYFEIYSCVISVSFVAWTRILDEVKIYQDVLDPSPTPTQTSVPALTPLQEEGTQNV